MMIMATYCLLYSYLLYSYLLYLYLILTEAEFWCVESEEAYCKDCKSIYSSLKYTKDHHIFNFDELIKDRSLQVRDKQQGTEHTRITFV